MSGKYNITVLQGTTFTLNGQMKLGSTGAPRNLTDYSISGSFRKEYNSTSATQFTCSIVTPTSGSFKVELSPSASSAISASDYVYDIEIYSGSYTERVLQGKLFIDPEVTR